MIAFFVGQAIGLPIAITGAIGLIEGAVLAGAIAVVAERVLFRMPQN